MDTQNGTYDPALFERVKALPKIELHRHLEGSLRLKTLAEIAQKHDIDLPADSAEADDVRPLVQITDTDMPSSTTYLSKFMVLRSFYQTPEIIDRLVYEVVGDAAAENTVYFELRFTPMALAKAKGFALADVSNWVLSAVERGKRDFGIDVRLILSMNRHESLDLGREVVELAIERMGRGVVGVDLAGAEAQHSGDEFAPVFKRARDAGLSVTIHAGEWRGAESIRLAVDKLGAIRLGHGVRVVEDSKVLQMARERQIAFEVCPTSNIQSGVVRKYEQHPLKDMYQVGLLTTINTDNTSVSGISLTDEYLRVMQYLGLTLDDIKQHVLNAARASFLPAAERDKLISRLTSELKMGTERTAAQPNS